MTVIGLPEERKKSVVIMWSLIMQKSYFLLGEKYKFVNARDILGSSNHHLVISQDKKKACYLKKGLL